MEETELLRALAAFEKALGELIKEKTQEIIAADFERIDKLMRGEDKPGEKEMEKPLDAQQERKKWERFRERWETIDILDIEAKQVVTTNSWDTGMEVDILRVPVIAFLKRLDRGMLKDYLALEKAK